MKDTVQLDVLVVYTGDIAASAGQAPLTTTKPFADSDDDYNRAYSYFLERCHQQGLTAALSTTNDVVGQGTCNSYWVYQNKNWEKVRKLCFAPLIFDKFTIKNKALKILHSLLFSSGVSQPFNNPYLKNIFDDKLATYQKLQAVAIPTVAITTDNATHIQLALKELTSLVAHHPHHADFSSSLILKDRSGSGGELIFKIDHSTVSSIQTIVSQYPSIAFIAQPFVHFDKGFTFNNHTVATDIRLIYFNGEIVQTYMRMAKPNDFRCNQHQGGTLIYGEVKDIPNAIQACSDRITTLLGDNSPLYSLDFIISNSGTTYLLEGNCNPGITWQPGFKKDEEMAKQLINSIVNEIAKRVEDKV